MKRFTIWVVGFTALFVSPGILRAQNPGPAESSAKSETSVGAVLPVVPITVNLERIPQFFREVLDPNKIPSYSSLSAEVDGARNPAWIQIVARERASGKQVYYCNSQNTVNLLTGLGFEAHYVPIQFNTSQDADSHSTYQFQFTDAAGRPIVWHFIQGDLATDLWGTSRFMPRADDRGFMLLRGKENYHAAPGSMVSIAAVEFSAAEGSFYSSDVVIADIQPVNEQWTLTSSPVQLNAGDKWMLRNSGGREAALTIQQPVGSSFIVDESEPNFPNAATVRMDLVKSDNQYALNSLTVMAQSQTFRIAFNPALPLPVPMAQDVTKVGFTMAEDNNPNVASGQLVASRGMGDEHLNWIFNSPEWAKAVQLNTGVSVLIGSETQPLKRSTPGAP